METTSIKDLKIGEVKVVGFVDRVRDQKSMQFVLIKDRSGCLQITIEKEKQPEIAQIFSKLQTGSVVLAEGRLIENPSVKQDGRELLVDHVTVLSEAEVSKIDEKSSIDQRLDYRWLDLRDPKKRLIFEVQTEFVYGMREYLEEKQFIEVHCPTISGNESESGAGVFEVKYFNEKAYLIQSPQFYKQMAIAAGFEKVFIQTPIYRAENSHTKQHATEFSGFDLEFGPVFDVEDVMRVEEELLLAGIKRVKEKLGEKVEKLLNVKIVVPSLPFPRITMKEAYKILDEELDYPIDEGEDFDRVAEKLLTSYMQKKTGHQFFFVKEYPSGVRPFYSMKKEDDLDYSKTYDLYFKDVEITSGAVREHRLDVLEKQIKEKGLNPESMRSTYLDFFKYGCPPHGGFGMGLDRITMLLLDLPSLKEAMFIFRGPDRLRP